MHFAEGLCFVKDPVRFVACVFCGYVCFGMGVAAGVGLMGWGVFVCVCECFWREAPGLFFEIQYLCCAENRSHRMWKINP